MSRSYIQGDVTALYQILISFFTGLKQQFPINPIANLSAPGIAFTVWKTNQLPKLHQEGDEVNEYIGLLPVRHNGRLVCPGGTFEGLFFSEELRFALDNDYQLLSVSQAYLFQRGVNSFRDLIHTLNEMKIQA